MTQSFAELSNAWVVFPAILSFVAAILIVEAWPWMGTINEKKLNNFPDKPATGVSPFGCDTPVFRCLK